MIDATFDLLQSWLLAPLSGRAEHSLAPALAWHARSMVLAWGVLLPLGALIARYYKVTPSQRWPAQLDNTAWWHAHRTLQYSGAALMLVGVALAWGGSVGATAVARAHAISGWALFALGCLQIAMSWLRGSKGGPTAAQLRGDHYDMTRWRQIFERSHKGLGWFCVLLMLAVIALGLMAADAPRWMPVVLSIWWLLLAAWAAHLQCQGRCIDTYQAIWGPALEHPGNRVAPIGWGVRRPPLPPPALAFRAPLHDPRDIA